MIGNLLIRVDSNPEIATGHLMRCMSIASEARSRGLDVTFLMSDNNNKEYVESQGFRYHDLNTDWTLLDKELSQMASIIGTIQNPVLLIDTYSITSSYVNNLKRFLPVIYLGSKLTDIGQPDCIINYSSNIDYAFYHRYYNQSKLLLGVKFAPLRKEFQKRNNDEISVLTDVLLTTGGADKPRFTESFLKKNYEFFVQQDINCHVVVGRMFLHVDKLEEYAYEFPNIIIHRNVQDMASLMKSCQLALSANGTTVYELAACGIPTVSFALVKEQEISGRTLGEMGIVDYCGLYSDNEKKCLDSVSEKLQYYSKHSDKRMLLGQEASTLIDGKGCEYIMDNIINISEIWS